MGFYSSFTTADAVNWPQWFREKYQSKDVLFHSDGICTISSKGVGKAHADWPELLRDIQKAIDWRFKGESYVVVYLHENGQVTYCDVDEGRISCGRCGPRVEDDDSDDFCVNPDPDEVGA